jgi:hypothetical protein
MIKLQRLLKEVTLIGYRGDKASTDINKFDRDLVFFTKDANVAKTFGDKITKAKITLTNPFTIENAGSWEDVPIGELFDTTTAFEIVKLAFGPTTYKSLDDYYDEDYGREPVSIDSVAAYLHKYSNHDGIIADNISEGPLLLNTTIYIIFDKKSIQPM